MNDVKKREEMFFTGIFRLNATVLGIVLGLLFGSILFIATNWLVFIGRGTTTSHGEVIVGPHLDLLSQFFIGYRVSFLGSFIGFAYGFFLGSVSGSAISWIYNMFVNYMNCKNYLKWEKNHIFL